MNNEKETENAKLKMQNCGIQQFLVFRFKFLVLLPCPYFVLSSLFFVLQPF